jgi:hypothetical protein
VFDLLRVDVAIYLSTVDPLDSWPPNIGPMMTIRFQTAEHAADTSNDCKETLLNREIISEVTSRLPFSHSAGFAYRGHCQWLEKR